MLIELLFFLWNFAARLTRIGFPFARPAAPLSRFAWFLFEDLFGKIFLREKGARY